MSARSSLPAMLVVVPAILAAVTLAVLEGLLWTGSPVLRPGDLSEASFTDALREGDMEGAFAFIRAGHDPNTPVVFRDPVLTGDRDIRIAPLLIAVANNRDDSVAMLMGYGVRLGAPGNRFAACLATRMGFGEIAAAITRDGGPVALRVTCPEQSPSADAPLAAYVE